MSGMRRLVLVPLISALVLPACDRGPTPAQPSATAEPAPPPPTPTVAAPPPSATAEPTAAAPAPSASVATAPSAKPKTPGVAPSASSAPAPERKVKTVGGSSHSNDSFSLSISAPSPVRAGQTAAASIVLNAKQPYHCNDKYPYKMTLDAPSGGVSYPEAVVRSMSIGAERSTMSVAFTPSQQGKATVSGTLSFSVCTADKCLIEKRPLSVTVDVD